MPARGRRKEDNEEVSALLRLTRSGEVLYEGEIQPGHDVKLPDGLRLQVLWIRTHHLPAAKS